MSIISNVSKVYDSVVLYCLQCVLHTTTRGRRVKVYVSSHECYRYKLLSSSFSRRGVRSLTSLSSESARRSVTAGLRACRPLAYYIIILIYILLLLHHIIYFNNMLYNILFMCNYIYNILYIIIIYTYVV